MKMETMLVLNRWENMPHDHDWHLCRHQASAAYTCQQPHSLVFGEKLARGELTSVYSFYGGSAVEIMSSSHVHTLYLDGLKCYRVPSRPKDSQLIYYDIGEIED